MANAGRKRKHPRVSCRTADAAAIFTYANATDPERLVVPGHEDLRRRARRLRKIPPGMVELVGLPHRRAAAAPCYSGALAGVVAQASLL